MILPSVRSRAAAVLLVALFGLSVAEAGAVVTEPKTGVSYPEKVGAMSLLGVGLRTKSFLKFRIYTLGFYVADSALAGPLAVYSHRLGTSGFYSDLARGDFEKQLVLKLVRDLSAEQIQGSFHSHMPSADRALLEQFASYFSAAPAGQELVLHWVPGQGLHTTVSGAVKPVIADKAFADAVFGIWLCDRPSEDPIRKQLVSRAGALLARRATDRTAN